jgi:hypothetical protein
LAQNLCRIIKILAEYILPFYLKKYQESYSDVKNMHNLCYLLARKCQEAFCSPVLRTCMDHFWDLKGLGEVLFRILKTVGMQKKHILPIVKVVKDVTEV